MIRTPEDRTAVANALATLKLGKPEKILKAIDSPTRQIIDGEAGSPADALDLLRRKEMDS